MLGTGTVARQRTDLSSLMKVLSSQTSISMVAGAVLISLLRFIQHMWSKWRAAKAEHMWRRRVDLDVVQACVLTTEHLQSLGRIEKRTLFVKPVSEVFRNEYILSRLLAEAEVAASLNDPMLVTRLTSDDKWHVLNTCSNHLSSCFAPYHVFFNEARRTESYYKSAWYCFTLTCTQTEASGRWFITPHKPVGKGDVGTRRIRIVLMNEQELRDVASGDIEPPAFGLFNDRHKARWNVCKRFGELFQRQLSKAEEAESFPPVDTASSRPLSQRTKGLAASSNALSHLSNGSLEASNGHAREEPEDNSLLRLHVPFPASRGGPNQASPTMKPEDCVSKDVVLYE